MQQVDLGNLPIHSMDRWEAQLLVFIFACWFVFCMYFIDDQDVERAHSDIFSQLCEKTENVRA